jgi:nicotinate dehydrogenase subunit B
MTAVNTRLTRRQAMMAGGSLVLLFSEVPTPSLAGVAMANHPALGSLKQTPLLDSWVRISPSGKITIFTGKVEFGQGLKTALIQIAADALDVSPGQIALVTADTALTPNEGFTAGSHSMQDSGTAILNAASEVRAMLAEAAASRFGISADSLRASNGVFVAPDGRQIGYGELIPMVSLHQLAKPGTGLKGSVGHKVMGSSLARVDIPAKVTGGVAYVQDLRLPGMVHSRVIRPPSYGARLRSVDTIEVERMPGVIRIMRDGNYLAVIADGEYQAIRAMRALDRRAVWQEQQALPDEATILSFLQRLPAKDFIIATKQGAAKSPAHQLSASYGRAYQIHGAIGPSCAVGLFENGALTIWTHSQGVYPLRDAVAELLGLGKAQVRCIHMEGAGCYGHNAADDAAADAALIAFAMPGRPVRVQWMREQEHMWEPFGPAMLTHVRASLDADGRIDDWHYEVKSNTHSTRPGGAGSLMPAWHIARPFALPAPVPIPQPEGGGDRNAIPIYQIPNLRVTNQFVTDMPLRVSALRSLGAYMNIFSIESFMDELAQVAGMDPIEFRLQHIEDARAREVILTASARFGWFGGAQLPAGHGRGFAFARYKNLAAYAAVAVEVDVERETGRIRLQRAIAAIDSGQAINPDGIRNQIEGGILQAASWTLYEAVTFDRTRITSRDWSGYPILRFGGVPEIVEVHVIDRPGQPFLGTGEAAQGPTAAAIANAVAQATGVRIRDLPLTAKQVRTAIGV